MTLRDEAESGGWRVLIVTKTAGAVGEAIGCVEIPGAQAWNVSRPQKEAQQIQSTRDERIIYLSLSLQLHVHSPIYFTEPHLSPCLAVGT